MTHDLKQRLVGKGTGFGTYGLINPDGPAALARIEELEGALAQAKTTISVLATAENGMVKSPISGKSYAATVFASVGLSALKGEERNG